MRIIIRSLVLGILVVTSAGADDFEQAEIDFFSNPSGINRTKSIDFELLPAAVSDVVVRMTVHGDFAPTAYYFLGSFGGLPINSTTVTPNAVNYLCDF